MVSFLFLLIIEKADTVKGGWEKNMMVFEHVGIPLYRNYIPAYSIHRSIFDVIRYSRNGKEVSIPKKFVKAFPDVFLDTEIWYVLS